jgi:hypothetical protein
MDDEIGIDNNIFTTIKDELKNEFMLAFSDLAEYNNNTQILAEFISEFSLKDSALEIKQVDACYQSIDNSLENISNMAISEDNVFDDNEKHILKINIYNIQEQLNRLLQFGLYDDSRTIILRDRIAESIRLQTIDLHNNLAETKIALNLLEVCISLSGTSSLKNKLEADKLTLSNIIIKDEYIEQITPILDEFKTDFVSENYAVTVLMPAIGKIADCILVDLRLAEESKINLLDNIAVLTRGQAVDLSNKGFYYASEELMKYTVSIVVSENLKESYMSDFITISCNRIAVNKQKLRNTGCIIAVSIFSIIILLVTILGGCYNAR